MAFHLNYSTFPVLCKFGEALRRSTLRRAPAGTALRRGEQGAGSAMNTMNTAGPEIGHL